MKFYTRFPPSYKVHNVVEYIKSTGDFLCDIDELNEREIQDILQKDFEIYLTLTDIEKQQLKDELRAMALQNELKEAKYLYDKLQTHDEGIEKLISNSKDVFSNNTAYLVYYSYPVDENLRQIPRKGHSLRYPKYRVKKGLNGFIRRRSRPKYTGLHIEL